MSSELESAIFVCTEHLLYCHWYCLYFTLAKHISKTVCSVFPSNKIFIFHCWIIMISLWIYTHLLIFLFIHVSYFTYIMTGLCFYLCMCVVCLRQSILIFWVSVTGHSMVRVENTLWVGGWGGWGWFFFLFSFLSCLPLFSRLST